MCVVELYLDSSSFLGHDFPFGELEKIAGKHEMNLERKVDVTPSSPPFFVEEFFLGPPFLYNFDSESRKSLVHRFFFFFCLSLSICSLQRGFFSYIKVNAE